jgi:hypothetical protein
MAIGSHLIDRCRIERATVTRSPYGNDTEVWDLWRDNVPCRFVQKRQQLADSATAAEPVVTTYLLLVPAGTDIRIGDRVTRVVLQDGTVDAGPYRIEEVLRRRGRAERHRSAVLERTA